MKGFEVKFNIYANSKEEAAEAQKVIIDFINDNAAEGRAVSAEKIVRIVPMWKQNALIRQQIANFFK